MDTTYDDTLLGSGYVVGGLSACSMPLVDPVSHHCPSGDDGSKQKSGDRLNTL